MSKQSGLGDRLLVGGHDISGDIQALDKIAGGPAGLIATDITQSGVARIGGVRDGSMAFKEFFDFALAHPVLSALPTADELMTFLQGVTLGNPCACLNAKEIGYDPARAADGSLILGTEGQGQGYGLEWGVQITPGVRTDTAATNGSSLNNGAATLWGAQAYLQATALTGTDVTVTLQHSPDNTTWITLLAFTELVSGNSNLPPSTQRVAAFSGAFIATDASPAVFTAAGSSFANGTPVQLQGTSLPAGFSASTTYYVVSASGSSFELAATSGGAAINSTSAGSGKVYQVVQQYVRAVTTTSGGFTSFSFAAALMRNPVAVVF